MSEKYEPSTERVTFPGNVSLPKRIAVGTLAAVTSLVGFQVFQGFASNKMDEIRDAKALSERDAMALIQAQEAEANSMRSEVSWLINHDEEERQ